MFKKLPPPLIIIFFIIIIAALVTWILPAGKYQTLQYQQDGTFMVQARDSSYSLPGNQNTLDSLGIKASISMFEAGEIRKPVAIPGTYQRTESDAQGPVAILQAPIKGIYDTVDIVLFVLIIGGFMGIFNATGALNDGLSYVAVKLKGREPVMIAALFFLFALAGASYGMAEEALAFYPLLLPLFRKAGYDNLIPAAVIFGGTQIGCAVSFSNPFSTIIASNLAGSNWGALLNVRLLLWFVTVIISMLYILRYARRVLLQPQSSLVLRYPASSLHEEVGIVEDVHKLSSRSAILIAIFLITFVTMIVGVLRFDWWLLEMTTIFLASAVLGALICGISGEQFVTRFVRGAEELLSVSLIVGVARGVTVVLNDGQVSDTIIYYCASAIEGMPTYWLAVLLFFCFMLFSLFISSTSGLAVLTIPILSSVALMGGVGGGETVSAYILGTGITQLWAPTGLVLPSLALSQTSFRAWMKFIIPLLLILSLLFLLFLVLTVSLQ